jgi:hypothetical protein
MRALPRPDRAYEPLWLELADGTLVSSSYTNLGSHNPHEQSRLWHLGCLAPDGVPPVAET